MYKNINTQLGLRFEVVARHNNKPFALAKGAFSKSGKSNVFKIKTAKPLIINPPLLMEYDNCNKKRTVTVKKGDIVAVYGDLDLAKNLVFQLDTTGMLAAGVRPIGEVSLDFRPESVWFRDSVSTQTVFEHVAQCLEGKMTFHTSINDWLEAFGLAGYKSWRLANLPRQAQYRLLALVMIARPVSVLRMTNTRNFEDFGMFLLDLKRFFRDHKKLDVFCPGFVVLEEEEHFDLAILADEEITIGHSRLTFVVEGTPFLV